MAKYRLRRGHYLQDKHRKIDPRFHAHGEVIEWEGAPSLQMEAVDNDAKERVRARQADFAERRAEGQQTRTKTGWTRSFERNLAEIYLRDAATPDAPPTAKEAATRRRRGGYQPSANG